MPLARTRTHVGKAKKTRNYGKRKAYKPRNKNKMMKKRQPFVETKSRTHEEIAAVIDDNSIMLDPTEFNIIPNVTSGGSGPPEPQTIVNLPIWSFCSASQGLGEDQMIGLSCYGKYLKAKLQFKLPDGANAITHVADMYLVHGFIKAPYARTSFTNPTAQTTTRADFKGWVVRHLKDFFDQREDKLRFIPKQNTNMRILGYRKIKPNRNASLGVGHYGTAQGTFPMINMSCYWPVKRKIYYSPGLDGSGKLQFLFPNSQQIPFMCVYNPTAAEFTSGDDYCVKCAYNDSFWYSDS